ncbi:MAG: phosphotransferase [Sandaracinus sp.]|nr:phosphotransferase [Sandaracinus sp.]
MDVTADGAIAVVKAHLRELGRACEVSVLADRSNLVLALDPSSSIARVAMATSASRVGLTWLKREVEVASFLAERGAPSTGPSTELPPGPHEREGYVLSYWAREMLVESVAPESKGRALADVHAALRDYPHERLPRLGAWDEARAMLPGLRASDWLDPGSRARVERAWDRAERVVAGSETRTASWQAVHGDAHLGNVLATPKGALWTDWEDAFLGPVEWDLATLISRHRLFGEEPTLPAVLAAYGRPYEPTLMEELLEARSLQAIVWLHLFAERDPSLRARVQARVDRLG